MKKYLIFVILSISLIATYLIFNSRPSDMANVDLDKNGVWDDLDRISDKYGKTASQREALRFYFLAQQEVLLNPDMGIKIKNESDMERLKDTTLISYDCLDEIWRKSSDETEIIKIKDEMLSSKTRIIAWLKFNQHLSGGFYALWNEKKNGNSCAVLRDLLEKK